MRRQDREVRTAEGLLEILEECKVCRVGLQDGDDVYVVPLSYGFQYEDGALTLYFHGAAEGRKAELLRNNPRVGFEMDCLGSIREGGSACECTCSFRSIIGTGRACVVEEPREKRKGLETLMRCLTGHEYEIQDAILESVCVWKITAEEFTGKFHS